MNCQKEHAVIGQRLPDGVTYRRLDFWCRLGYIRPYGDPMPGNGRVREWPDSELEAAAMMARLRAAGIELPVAAKAARDLIASADGTALLPGGLLIMTAERTLDETEVTA